ncbi:MAG: choice-of-anchor J domain-containing protein [Weeksellaceae bacterium]|nr:choice-of-anchor J domain-containing protein [Weeksellaceae bacterium]
MKKMLLSLTVIAGFSFANAQTVIFEDDFESYEDFLIDGIGDWIMIDVDGSGTYTGGGGEFPNQFDPKAFMVFNPFEAGVTNSDGSDGEFRDFDPYSGDKYMAAWASVEGPNDDWMISPPITLGTNSSLQFYVKSMSDTYGLEEFNYWIYEGADIPTPSDFSWYGMDMAPAGDWMEVTEDLSLIAPGTTIRIGIQCTSNDAYMLMVDDVRVTGSLGLSEVGAKTDTAIYPNPVIDTFSLNLSKSYNMDNVQVAIYDLTGKKLKEFGSATTYDISEFAEGVYIVRISDGKHNITKKIVKK